jgi:hypothetical protein
MTKVKWSFGDNFSSLFMSKQNNWILLRLFYQAVERLRKFKNY